MRAVRRARPLAWASACLLACDSPTVVPATFAYDPTSLTGGVRYRWSTNQRVRVFVEPTASGTPGDVRAAVERGVAQWNRVPRGDGFTLEVTATRSNAHVVVFERATPLPLVPDAGCPFSPGSAGGYTYFCAAAGGRAAALRWSDGGAGVLSVAIRVDAGRADGQGGLDALVAHELGHAVGIGGHSDDSGDVMFPQPRVAAPSGRDTQTLRWLLGQSVQLIL